MTFLAQRSIQPTARPALVAAWLFLFAMIVAVFAFSPNYRLGVEPLAGPYGGDLLQEWLGGTVVLRGDYSRFYDVEYARALQHDPRLVGFAFDESRYLPLVYPPFYYALLSPLALVSYPTAVWVWSVLMIAVLASAVAILAKMSDDKSSPWVVVACAVFAPALENLNSGQKGAVCLLILVATYHLLRSDRRFLAGIVFGLLAFKPQLAVIVGLGMLCRGQIRFALGAATTVAVFVAICFALGGGVCSQYVAFARGAAEYIQTGGYDLTKSHSWYGCFTLLLGAGLPAKIATAVAAIATIALAFAGKQAEWSPHGEHFPWRFSALVLAGLLCSPHLYTYDLTILLLPMALAVATQNRRNIFFAAIAFVAAGAAPTIAAATSFAIMPLILFAWLATLTLSAAPSAVAIASPPSPACR